MNLEESRYPLVVTAVLVEESHIAPSAKDQCHVSRNRFVTVKTQKHVPRYGQRKKLSGKLYNHFFIIRYCSCFYGHQLWALFITRSIPLKSRLWGTLGREENPDIMAQP